MEEAKFVIDGREYPIPDLDGFTMGEALTLHDYTGLSIDEVDEDTPRMPLIAGFMHIAYERGNPGVNEAKIKRLIKSANLAEALEKMAGEDDANPPAELPKSEQLTPEPLESSRPSEITSGNGSTSASGEPEDVLSPTGTGKLDMSPTSDRATSVT